jgi:hypothetical protein
MGIIKNYHDKKWTLQFLDALYNSKDTYQNLAGRNFFRDFFYYFLRSMKIGKKKKEENKMVVYQIGPSF